MCLRLLYLFVTRLFGWLRLSHREESWKSAEILLLRHQLGILQRQVDARPKVTWADRALLAGLLGVIPKARRAGLRLVVTPDTVLRWHRDIVRKRWRRSPSVEDSAARLPIAECAPWFCAWPGRTPTGATAASTAS